MKDNQLHPRDVRLWREVVRIGIDTARAFKLPLFSISPSNTGDCNGTDDYRSAYGWCNPGTGCINIVPRFRTADDAGWLQRRTKEDILQTLAHELAHLRVRGHGKRFAATMDNIHNYIRRVHGSEGKSATS